MRITVQNGAGASGFSPPIKTLLQGAVILSREEEQRLFHLVCGRPCIEKEALRAHERLFTSYARFIAQIAFRYRHRARHLHPDDLFIVGTMGFMRGLETFDWRRSRLSSYVSWWIAQAIRHEIENHNRTIRLPVHVSDGLQVLRKAAHAYVQETGLWPSEEVLVLLTDMKPVVIRRKIAAAMGQEVSIHAVIPGAEGLRLEDLLEDESKARTADAELYPDDETLRAPESLSRLRDLDPFEREIIILRLRGWTFRKIGKRLGVTRERIRQRMVRAMLRVLSQPSNVPPLTEPQVAAFRRAVDVALQAEEDEQINDASTFSQWLRQVEPKPELAGLDELVDKEHILEVHAELMRHFWSANDPGGCLTTLAAEKLVYRDRKTNRKTVKKFSLRGICRILARATWLAHRQCLGLPLPKNERLLPGLSSATQRSFLRTGLIDETLLHLLNEDEVESSSRSDKNEPEGEDGEKDNGNGSHPSDRAFAPDEIATVLGLFDGETGNAGARAELAAARRVRTLLKKKRLDEQKRKDAAREAAIRTNGLTPRPKKPRQPRRKLRGPAKPP